MNYVRWFDEIRAADVDLVGGKGANLGEMVAAGLPVPPGFCLVTAAYRAFIKASSLEPVIAHVLARTRLDDPDDVRLGADRIRGLIVDQPVPRDVAEEVVDSYYRLGQALGVGDVEAMPVAVRSSATAEDLPTASFAGQQETFLNVRGEIELLDRVRACWASLWTDRAILYRARQGLDPGAVALAVVVQAMIASEVSGVLFTADPVTGDRDTAVVNASWGLGEAIVSGAVTPDTFTVRMADGVILSRQIAAKELTIEYGPDGGSVERETPGPRRSVPALSDGQVSALVALGREIEARYGAPQDIEWAYAAERFYIVQTRPITTLERTTATAEAAVAEPGAAAGSAPAVAAAVEYNRSMLVELFPDPLTPSLLSVIEPLVRSMFDSAVRGLGFEPAADMEATAVFYNQPYFNREYIAAALRPLSPPVRERLVSQIIHPWGRHEGELPRELSLPFLGMGARVVWHMARLRRRLPDLVADHRADAASLAALGLAGASEMEGSGAEASRGEVSEAEAVALAKHALLGSTRRLLDFDFLLIAVIGISYQILGALLARTFGDEADSLRGRLISGVTGNVTMEANTHLWDLAQVAKASPAVCELLQAYSSAEVLPHLEAAPEAEEFLEALARFLSEYGHREVRLDILYPTWGEDPAPVLGFVRGYLDADEDQGPHRQQARLAAERQELTAEVVHRLRDSGLAGRVWRAPLLRWLLHHTRANTRERETAHFELTRIFPPIRRLLRLLGGRWSQAGLMNRAGDVYYLRLEEIEELASNPHPVHELVRARRAEFEASRARSWPDIIRGGKEIYAPGAAPGAAAAGQLQGVATSQGVVSGVARVIRGPDEFHRLRKRDILVAPLTNPVWTPLFAIAGGLVTEVGGMLSHGAIVAREYGIPAVMSVPGATAQVRDGQTITVDGNQGIVLLGAGDTPPAPE